MAYDSTFLYHEPCPNCGSSDANSVYSDGHTFCFSCKHHTRGGQEQEVTSKNVSLINHSPQPLQKRKLLKKTCEFFQYGVGNFFDKKSGKTLPCQVEDFYWKGKRVAQHVRLPDKDFRWIGDAQKVEFWGQHLWKGSHRTLVVTEGAVDAMSIAQVTDLKLPVVSIPSGADSAVSCFKRNLEWVTRFRKIVLAFDNDDPGKEAIEKVVPLLPVGHVFTIDMGQYKDANEMLKAGEGARLAQLVYDPEVYRPDGIISGGDLWDDLISEVQPGLSIPFPILNNKLQGFRPGQLFLFTAGSGIGKTTFVRELGYHLLTTHGQTLGNISLEESRKKTAKFWAGLHLNKPIHVSLAGVTKAELKRAYDEVLNCGRLWLYDHWGSKEVDILLNKINYMAVSLGVQWVTLDHISIVVSGQDEIGSSERKMIDILMTKLRKLIDTTGIGILAIVHLKRPDKGESFNEGRVVSLTDLRGSASLEQLSDVVIALERNQQDDENKNISRIRLLKDRDINDTGVADSIIFNPSTGRMYPYQGEIQGAFKKNNVKKKEEDFNDDF